MWMLVPLLSCQGKAELETTEDTGTSGGFTPTIPTSRCGETAYSWLPTDRMGDLIEIEDVDELSLPKETINLLLEQLGVGGLAPVPYDVKTYRVRYLTQNRGSEIEATGFVTLPEGRETAAPPLLWTHPTTGFTDSCAPTAQGLEGAGFPILWAALGYAVAAPDYIGMAGWGEPSGMLHPYIVAEPTAVASLDSIRAMVNLIEQREPELSLAQDKAIFWGASEGGYAALISDRYRPHYLPDFQTVATVAAIPATNLQELARLSMEELHDSTFALLAVMMTQAEWYGGSVTLSDAAIPAFAEQMEPLLQQCEDFGAADGITGVEEVYQAEFIEAALDSDWDALMPWGCYFEENSITLSQIPIENPGTTLIITAENDDLALPEPVKSDILTLCSAGYDIEHRECADANHVAGARDTLEAQLEWIAARVAGEPMSETCVVQPPVPCE
ncbi:MAG: lipase family protein [Myxococcota bacterium]|nr:lipase family protein [Myxococcota bacterium]